MKKVFQFLVSCAFLVQSFQTQAQINTPVESPSASFTQKFGLTEIKMEYSRPSVKNRKIFGNVVIFDKIWRIGANSSTKFSTTDSLTIAGKGLSKGNYIMLAIPNKDEWTIIFNKNLEVSYENYKPEFNVLEVKIKPKKTAQFVETFGIQTNNLTKTSCDLELAWENTLIQIPLQNEPHSKIMAEIKQKLGGPTKADFQTIAGYYYEHNIDLKSALEYIDKGIAQGEGYGNLRMKSLILAKMGNKKEAIVWAEKSLARAKMFSNADYIRMNEEAIAEWKK
ncbi:MAG: DUF2911 domain-containing protein [Saprospiraceae bacterium]|nr:DUF2911 domain-containing protein [Saprospiraceae bacterium]